MLLLNANQSVSSGRLIDELWGERPPKTAPTILHGYVSQLRRVLEPEHDPDASYELLVTEPTGYRLRVESERVDLHRFEQLFAAANAKAEADPAEAAGTLRDALSLWRGPPLADFTYDAFAQAAIGRLKELRLAAVEQRLEVDLAAGRHAELVGELEELIAAHPLRERPRRQLMLALYRSGRQSDALAAYQEARKLLVDELGIEPGPALQQLEREILSHDPGLLVAEPASSPAQEGPPRPERSILLVSAAGDATALVAVAEPLALSHHPHELIVARLLSAANGGAQLAAATSELQNLRAALGERGVAARVAAFTSSDLGDDLGRLASEQDVDLVLTDAGDGIVTAFPKDLETILHHAPSDVGVVVLGAGSAEPTEVLVPFGGAEHDWAALELGAWLASAHHAPLRLLGVTMDESAGRRDASRLLASASLAVQQLVGVVAEPQLMEPGAEGVLSIAGKDALLVVGFPDEWQREGLGPVRAELVRDSTAATFFVRRGVRPGGLAPKSSLTRFTWSLITQAHDFFRLQVEEWLNAADGEEDERGRAHGLETALFGLLVLVVIDLSNVDDPFVIFETLNARGTPLLASDLVKNYVLQRATLVGLPADELYASEWKPFEEDWWRTEIAQGRLYRPRIDVFLNYWLIMRMASEVQTNDVFPKFKEYSEQNGMTIDAIARDLRAVGEAYQKFDQFDPWSPTGAFFYRWRTIEAGVTTPLLLWLFSHERVLEPPSLQQSLGALESFLVRRMVCRMTAKNYNELFTAG
jgi:DNA-binding SARP family transcriptional activator